MGLGAGVTVWMWSIKLTRIVHNGCLQWEHGVYPWLVVWNHGIIYCFPYIGNFILSQLTKSIIFQRGRYTTNQITNMAIVLWKMIVNSINSRASRLFVFQSQAVAPLKWSFPMGVPWATPVIIHFNKIFPYKPSVKIWVSLIYGDPRMTISIKLGFPVIEQTSLGCSSRRSRNEETPSTWKELNGNLHDFELLITCFYHGFYIIHFHQGSFRFIMDISIVEMGKNKFQLVVSWVCLRCFVSPTEHPPLGESMGNIVFWKTLSKFRASSWI